MTPEQVAAELGRLPTEEFVSVIRDALANTQAAPRRHEVAVLLRLLLTKETLTQELAGGPQNVLDVSSVLDAIDSKGQ